MDMWDIAFGAGILGVFAIFIVVLACVSQEYSRAKRRRAAGRTAPPA